MEPHNPETGDEPIELDRAFDRDYLHFYAPFEDPDLVQSEAQLIADLAALDEATEVLDLGCGTGRIATALAEHGIPVTGLDQSELLLSAARSRPHGDSVRWEQADYRELVENSRFDVVVSWFTAFGYFDDATDRDVLRRLHNALRPGGTLILDAASLMQVAGADGQSEIHRRGEDLLIDEVRYDPLVGRRITDRTVCRCGEPPRTFRFPLRVFTPTELCSWLEVAGFVEVEFFDEDGHGFHLDATRMIARARKPQTP
ncbi:MAG: class I SAM-dependent methyltransferase [Planctomycetota bacterium]